MPLTPPGRPAPVRIDDGQSRYFRTRLRWGAEQPVNFAGHYIVAQWGCGAECLTAAAIDRRTGRVSWLPFNVCCLNEPGEMLEFRTDSRLLVVRGSRNEKGYGTYYYRLDPRGFTLVQATEIRR